jgi:hypothetical protein
MIIDLTTSTILFIDTESSNHDHELCVLQIDTSVNIYKVTQNQSIPKNLSKLVRINNQTKFNVVANPAKSIDCFDSFNCPKYFDFKNKGEFHLNDDNYFDTNISNLTNRKQHGTFNLNQRIL